MIDFSNLALQYCRPTPHDSDDTFDLHTDLQSRLFNAALSTQQFDLAYTTLTRISDVAIQHSSLRSFIFRMCECDSVADLLSYSFTNLSAMVDSILLQKCRSITDVMTGTPYHQILYAWRMKHNDFRGAASISYERLEALMHSGKPRQTRADEETDELDTPITRQYLTLINALSCVDEKQAWILADMPALPTTKNKTEKRRVVRLEDARRAYQAELDLITAEYNGRFAFAGDGDVEML